jgi:hypothetical protein
MTFNDIWTERVGMNDQSQSERPTFMDDDDDPNEFELPRCFCYTGILNGLFSADRPHDQPTDSKEQTGLDRGATVG